MKIRKIKFHQHPVLGDLELNLVNQETGLPYDTIVFAGENGTGKTSILESLSTFLNKRSIRSFSRIEYEANGNMFAVEPLDDGMHVDVGYHKRINLTNGSVSNIHSAAGNSEERINNDLDDLRHYGCIYTKVRSNYSSQPIKGTTASELDTTVYDTDSKEDFTSLKQLMVDIDTQDNRDLRVRMDNFPNEGFNYADFKNKTRMSRFQSAFDNFFELIKFKGVEPESGNMEVFFEKHGQKIKIDTLSTGEKQIVYRGAYLLRNVGKLDGAAILIDEPELSMHPKWQMRILKYFKDLFTTADGSQRAQLFFATHSEYVLGEALKDKDKTLVIVLKDINGTIDKHEVKTPLVLPVITASEINYAAFDVPSVDYHIALYGAIQSKYGVHHITDCDSKIESCTPYYQVAKHERLTPNPNKPASPYKTVCTKVRNHIDHPDTAPAYTIEEMKDSIILMRDILMNVAP